MSSGSAKLSYRTPLTWVTQPNLRKFAMIRSLIHRAAVSLARFTAARTYPMARMHRDENYYSGVLNLEPSATAAHRYVRHTHDPNVDRRRVQLFRVLQEEIHISSVDARNLYDVERLCIESMMSDGAIHTNDLPDHLLPPQQHLPYRQLPPQQIDPDRRVEHLVRNCRRLTRAHW
jgi:hypothetical protein